MCCGSGDKTCGICFYADGGCLASMRDDFFCPATKKQVEKRLAEGRYSCDREIMENYLKTARELPDTKIPMCCESKTNERVHFILDGCDISFGAEAPADITLAELLKQCDRVKPDYCACGIRSYNPEKDYSQIELSFDYDDVCKTDENVSCSIEPKEDDK